MSYGTDAQGKYLLDLASRLGYPDVAHALADMTQFGAAKSLTNSEASDAITQLKACLPADEATPTGSPAAALGAARPRFLTARHLRQINEGKRPAPADLDEDASWVLDRLQRLVQISQLAGSPTQQTQAHGVGVNEGRPIEMADLLRYYKTWDALAEAFKVAVTTAKAWGTLLPPGRAFEAEVRTGGFVRAPRG